MATSDSHLSALLGDSVIDNTGATHKVEDIAGKAEYIGILFSAHWCPPCRAFCPELKTFYAKMKDQLEIVFVSSDRSEEQFTGYFSEMPWKAVAYSDRSRKATLASKFGIRGIPALIIVDKNGDLVTDKGRQGVASDPEGARFPWRPRSAVEELKQDDCKLEAHGAGEVAVDSVVSHRYLGLYFSASWCPPCQAFTPRLIEWYKKMKERGEDLELLYMSGDRSLRDFEAYHSKMPWPAVSFSCRDVVGRLNALFEVRGIPTLVLLDTTTGKPIVADGRSRVDTDGDSFPWPPKAVETLMNVAGDLNTKKTAVLFVDKMTDTSALEAVQATLKAVADDYFPDSSDTIVFAVADDDEITDRLRQQTGLGRDRDGPKAAKLVIYDIAGGGLKYVMDTGGELPTEAAMKEFVDSVVKGSASGVSLRA